MNDGLPVAVGRKAVDKAHGHDHPVDAVLIEGRHGQGHRETAHELEKEHHGVWILVHHGFQQDRYGNIARDDAAYDRHIPVHGQLCSLCSATTFETPY